LAQEGGVPPWANKPAVGCGIAMQQYNVVGSAT